MLIFGKESLLLSVCFCQRLTFSPLEKRTPEHGGSPALGSESRQTFKEKGEKTEKSDQRINKDKEEE